MPRKTTRLYYGLNQETGKPLYWTLKVRNATKPVVLEGTIEDAMKGEPGKSIGCHLSRAGMRNKSKFGHPVLYISFTRSTALVLTKISKGRPIECVRYRHNYSKYVNLNDCDPSKKTVREHPEFFNRQFTLGAYRTSENHWKPEYGRRETGQRKGQLMAVGELRRMRDAGLIHATL